MITCAEGEWETCYELGTEGPSWRVLSRCLGLQVLGPWLCHHQVRLTCPSPAAGLALKDTSVLTSHCKPSISLLPSYPSIAFSFTFFFSTSDSFSNFNYPNYILPKLKFSESFAFCIIKFWLFNMLDSIWCF